MYLKVVLPIFSKELLSKPVKTPGSSLKKNNIFLSTHSKKNLVCLIKKCVNLIEYWDCLALCVGLYKTSYIAKHLTPALHKLHFIQITKIP